MVALRYNNRKKTSAKFAITNEGKIVRTYTERREVAIDSDLNEFEVGLLLAYVPGQNHSFDLNAVLVDMSLERQETTTPWCLWDLVLNYSTEGPPLGENSTDPTMQRVLRTWQTSEQTLHIVKDRNGDAILNAAGMPFEGGIPVSVELPTLVYTRNESTFSGAIATAYANSLNKYAFSGAEPGTLKLKISADEKHEGEYDYWVVRYEMAYFPLGWQPKPVNAGLYQLIDDELVVCRDRDRNPVSSPVPLYEEGEQIPIEDATDDLNYVDVYFFNEMDFEDLGLVEV